MVKSTTQIPSCSDCENKDSMFCLLSQIDKDTLGANKGNNFYKKGQSVFYEGNQSHGLYCIYKGKVKISKMGEGGKEQVIRFAKTGDILGYRSLFNNEPYQATATVLEDAYICHLSKDKYLKILKENPSLSWNTMKLLSNDLKNAETHLINIAQKTVKERIVETLLLLQSTFGFEKDEKTISVVLTRSEIADVAGTTTETAIRTLSELNKEGVINLVAKKIQIPNIKELQRVANVF